MSSSRLSRLAAALFLVFMLVSGAWAESSEVLTLPAALAVGSEYAPAVVDAERALADARLDLELAQLDPATTPLALAAAERAVAAAEDGLASAIATAKREVVAAYAALLETRAAQAVADQQLEILGITLQATRARFEAGAVTAADVSRAENDVARQQRALQEAESDLGFARDALTALLGREVGEVAPMSADDRLPEETIEAAVASAPAGSARVAAAQRALEAAQEQLAATDNALSSRVEVEAARARADSAAEAIVEVRAAAVREVQRAAALMANAGNRHRGAHEALVAAEAELAAQGARLEAGTISELAYRQAELGYENARAAEAAALHALVSAQYALLEVAAR